MNRILIALLATAMLCAMAWLVGTEDVIDAATWGTICVGAAALCVLWRDRLRDLFGRRDRAHSTTSGGLSSVHMALAIVLLLIFASSRGPGVSLTGVPWELLGVATAVCVVAYFMRRLRKRRRRASSPPTPMRSRSSWTPPASPGRDRPASSGDMGKTRPMPPM